jgi:phospholipid N-methyltransferase
MLEKVNLKLKTGESIARGTGMKKVLNELSKRGVDISQVKALELFGGKGNWQTIIYAEKVQSLDVWEIRPDFENSLRKNLPYAKIMIGDSIKWLKSGKDMPKYDFVVVDNPMSVFDEHQSYCEHFDVFEHINKILNDRCIISFNVNKQPFDFANQLIWKQKRSNFYDTDYIANFSLSFLLTFYETYFRKLGFNTTFSFSVSRMEEHNKDEDYFHYLVYSLKKQ